MEHARGRRTKEIALLLLVSLAAVIANLPPDLLHSYGLEQRYMIALLGIVIVISLFLYLRFFFFLLYALLAIGANLPTQWAEALGISKTPLLISLVAMVVFSLLNYFVKLMPTGIEVEARKKSPQGIRALINAIERSNLPQAQQVLKMNFDPDDLGDNGYSPLMCAAIAGNGAMVELLLAYKADVDRVGQDGLTAVELAYKHDHAAVADILKAAREKARQVAAAMEPPTTTVMG
jgi:hypothetical protein